jgi:hypothetical protein
MDRNLGATQAATSATDANAYGHLFQWGRGDDGGQLRNSSSTTTQYTSDSAGNLFVRNDNDWRNPAKPQLWNNGINIPIPTGWRLPTIAELNAERLSWASNNAAGAYGSNLKWTKSGQRYGGDGNIYGAGSYGYYWSSDIDSARSKTLYFDNSQSLMLSSSRSNAMPVRLIKLPPPTFKSILGLDRSKIKSFNGLAIDKIKQVHNLT